MLNANTTPHGANPPIFSKFRALNEAYAKAEEAIFDPKGKLDAPLNSLSQALRESDSKGMEHVLKMYSLTTSAVESKTTVKPKVANRAKSGVAGFRSEQRRFWDRADKIREKFRRFAKVIEARAEENGLSPNLNDLVTAKAIDLIGPKERTSQDTPGLALLDRQLEFTSAFQALDYVATKRVVEILKELKIDDLLSTRGTSRPLDCSAVVNAVTRAYGIPSVTVSELQGKEQGYIGIFKLDELSVGISVDLLQKVFREDPSLVVFTLLHEARHAVLCILLDNWLYSRGDGSLSLHSYNATHAAVDSYPEDMKRILVSMEARHVKRSIVVFQKSAAEVERDRYRRLFSEKDADEFARNVLSKLVQKEVNYSRSLSPDRSVKSNSDSESISETEREETPQSSLVLSDEKKLNEFANTLLQTNTLPSGAEYAAKLIEMVKPDLLSDNKNGTSSLDPLLIGKAIEKTDEQIKVEQKIADRKHSPYERLSQSFLLFVRGFDFEDPDSVQVHMAYMKESIAHIGTGTYGLKAARIGIVAALSNGPQKRHEKNLKTLLKQIDKIAPSLSESVVESVVPTAPIGEIQAALSFKFDLTSNGFGYDGSRTLRDVTDELEENKEHDCLLVLAKLLAEAGQIIEKGFYGTVNGENLQKKLLELRKPLRKVEDREVRRALQAKVRELLESLG